MEFRHELIDFGDAIPLKCFTHRLGHSPLHWHNSLELLFVVSGTVQILVDGTNMTYEPDDVLLINSNAPHELIAEDCVLVAVQIRLSMFHEFSIPFENLHFNCNSRTTANPESLDNIRQIIAQFVKTYATNDVKTRALKAKSLSYALMYELINGFSVEKTEKSVIYNQHQHDRISNIVSYINEHYREDLTLLSLAEHEYLSVPYLSKFFAQTMGITFSDYLTSVRLNHAINALISTKDTVENIAQDSGFPTAHSFVQQFKKKYGMLPSHYRKKQQAGETSWKPTRSSMNDYTILDTHQYLSMFRKYLDRPAETTFPAHTESGALQQTYCEINTEELCSPFSDSHRMFTSVGCAHDLLLSNIQRMIVDVQKDVGFEYVKFHGIFSDEMHVYTVLDNGEPFYNFIYVDEALDFLQSVHLKPLIQLAFMPREMARYPERRIFETTMINSPPTDLNSWCDLVKTFLNHILDRYGAETVRSWLFTVWNEPDTPPTMFGFDDEEEFFEFYRQTRQTVKDIDQQITFGTPEFQFIPHYADTWITRFTNWCIEHHCLGDCLFMHYYGVEVTYLHAQEQGFQLALDQLRLTEDENAFKKAVDILHSYAKSVYGPDTRIYLTEWNYTSAHFDLLSDTCFRSCYIAKNILENHTQLQSFGMWVLSDLLSEHPIPEAVFHGGLGLMTYNGIKKPAYYAFSLLCSMGDHLVAAGDGWCITKRNQEYQIMLYHYLHYSKLYAEGEYFDLTDTNRYTVFNSDRREFILQLKNVPKGVWQAKEYSISRQSGSSFDKWVEMGAKPIQGNDEVHLLKSLSLPMINKYASISDEKGLNISAILEPLEVRLILLKQS